MDAPRQKPLSGLLLVGPSVCIRLKNGGMRVFTLPVQKASFSCEWAKLWWFTIRRRFENCNVSGEGYTLARSGEGLFVQPTAYVRPTLPTVFVCIASSASAILAH